MLPELSISLKSHGYIVSRKASVRGVHHQQLARRRPGTACSLGKKQQHVFAFIKQGALDQIDRARDCCLFEVLRVHRTVHASLRDRADIEAPLGFANGHGMSL